MTAYEKLISYLFSIKDEKYQKFHQGLVPDSNCIIGVKIPILTKIAKYISKNNPSLFINEYYNRVSSGVTMYFEEDIIMAKLISLLPYEKETFFFNFNRFLDRVTNWSVCDTFCTSLTPVKKCKDEFFLHINTLLTSNNPWHIRVGLVCMLSWYIDETHISEVLDRTYSICNNHYYIEMAQAWLLATAYAKCRDKTHEYLLNHHPISDSVLKKTLQKLRDSLRVSKDDSLYLTQHFSK